MTCFLLMFCYVELGILKEFSVNCVEVNENSGKFLVSNELQPFNCQSFHYWVKSFVEVAEMT